MMTSYQRKRVNVALSIILLLLIGILSCNAQNKGDGVWINDDMIDITQEYVNEAKTRGIDVVPALVKMKYIGYGVGMGDDVAGMSSPTDIYIHYSCKDDYYKMRYVMFHELTHSIFNVGHDECGEFEVMNRVAPREYSIYKDDVFWSKRLDVLFKNKSL